jgi:hypothetical protein
MNKATILAIILLAILGAGALLVNREMRDAQARPAVQRQLSQSRLAQFAEALKAYRDAHQAWPESMAQLLREAKLPPTSTAVRGAGVYRYRKPSGPVPPDLVVMWSDRPHDGIKAGEPWGGEGGIATTDVPPVAYVLNGALEIEALSPETWAKRIPPPGMAPAP